MVVTTIAAVISVFEIVRKVIIITVRVRSSSMSAIHLRLKFLVLHISVFSAPLCQRTALNLGFTSGAFGPVAFSLSLTLGFYLSSVPHSAAGALFLAQLKRGLECVGWEDPS